MIADARTIEVSPTIQWRRQYTDRIAKLAGYGHEDGIALSATSESDFWSFVGEGQTPKRASLFLLDNGNLRAVWTGDDGDRVGVQFFGEGVVEYAISKPLNDSGETFRTSGTETMDGVKRLLRDYDLAWLVNA